MKSSFVEYFRQVVLIAAVISSVAASGRAVAQNAAQRSAEFERRMNLSEFRDAEGTQTIANLNDWEAVKPEIIERFEQVAGKRPDSSRRCDLKPRMISEVLENEYVRQKWAITPEPGDETFVWLLIPRGNKSKYPAALCLHPTHEAGKDVPVGLAGDSHRFYAKELVERGYVCLSPDYGPFSENVADPYALGYQSATMKGIWNHIRCVDFLTSLSCVDSEKIVAIGHSLGGHNALFVSMFDERIRAVATSCGFTTFFKYYQGDLAGWSQDKYMPLIKSKYQDDPALVPFDFNEILASIAPRPIFINAPINDDNFDASGVRDCVRSANFVYSLYENPDGIVLTQPESSHDFPDVERFQAYDFLDSVLNIQRSSPPDDLSLTP